jgi:hypothetical protein
MLNSSKQSPLGGPGDVAVYLLRGQHDVNAA